MAIGVVMIQSITGCVSWIEPKAPLARTDHFVSVKSTAPSLAGSESRLYVREVRQVGHPATKVVLFVHGASTAAEVAFDVPHKDYSWMAYLARGGFDVFAMDLTGYGRSTRPEPMNDPCNLPKAQQARLIPEVIPNICPPSYATPITTIKSDWDDIAAVVEFIRDLRQVESVSLVGWSQGGPRTSGYAIRNPGKVSRLVVLAPAYERDSPSDGPTTLLPRDGSFKMQTRSDFDEKWDRQVGCPEQFDPKVREIVWSENLASDPVGATWGKGVRRAPIVSTWGFNQSVVRELQIPYLMITGLLDNQVNPNDVRDLYADLGSPNKVLVEMPCTSHDAMWEKNRLMLFRASLEWLQSGTVNGQTTGVISLGH